MRPSLLSFFESEYLVIEIIQYLDSVYDYQSLIYSNKTILQICLTNKLLKFIVFGNLNKLTTQHLSLSFEEFRKNILHQFGFVLSGSTVLYGLCGNNWGWHSPNSNHNIKYPLIKHEDTFSESQQQFLTKHNINKEPDDYDLYIHKNNEFNKSNFNSNNKLNLRIFYHKEKFYSFTDYLQYKYEIYLDYDINDDINNPVEEAIHYMIVHIQNLNNKELALLMLTEISNQPIKSIKDVVEENGIQFLKRIFDVMYIYRLYILDTYSELQDVNNEYYNKINVLRLFYINKKTEIKTKIQIIFNNEYQTKFENYDFEFLKTFIDPFTDEPSIIANGGINYNGSLQHIINRNKGSKPYKHVSACINPRKQLLCKSLFPVYLSANYNYSKSSFKIRVGEMIMSGILRSLKYSSRGFNCMNTVYYYAGTNLSSLYLAMKVAVTKQQTEKLKTLLHHLIMLQDNIAIMELYYIYLTGIDLYKYSCLNELPNIEGMAYIANNELQQQNDDEDLMSII